MIHYLEWKVNSNGGRLFVSNHGGQDKLAHHFQVLKGKKLSTMNATSGETILQDEEK